MKAASILQQYQNGERNFQGLNLRGLNLAGKDLSGANFSYCDIRGTNFKEANLTGANFTGVKAGLQKRWEIGLFCIAFVLIVLSSNLSAIVGYLVALVNEPDISDKMAGWISLLTLVIFCVVTYHQNLRKGLVAFITSFTIIVAIVVFSAGINAIDFAGAGVGAIVFAAIEVLAFTGIEVVAFAFAKIVAIGVGIIAVTIAFASTIKLAGIVAGVFSGSLTLFACFIGYRTIKNETRDPWLRQLAIAFATIGGTSFYGAILTDANFAGAALKNTNFNQAHLTRTCFKNTVKLNLARVGNTLLSNPIVRDLLINPSNGYNINLFKANLRGANLEEANLQEANLSQADVSEATFQYANLREANLTEINGVKTNFNHALLTGACLENWNIDATTILDKVECQYVYLLNNKQERRPSSDDFEGNEFSKLFAEVFDTVDLIFRDGIDWKAFLSSMKEVQVKNEETPLEVQSIENKGDGVIVVKVKVTSEANKEKIHQDFNEVYQLKLAAMEERYQRELAEKDKENADKIIAIERKHQSDMMEIIKTQARQPSQTYNFKDTHFDGGFAGKDYSGDVENSQQKTNDES